MKEVARGWIKIMLGRLPDGNGRNEEKEEKRRERKEKVRTR